MRVILAALAAVLALATPATAAQLLPHRAVYSLTLTATDPGSTIGNAVGDLVFEIDDLCDAWSSLTEMRFQVLYDDGTEIRFGTSIAAWEAKDGLTYRFFVKRRSNYEEPEDVEGEATLAGPEQGGVATFAGRSPRSLALPPGTLFPTRHSLLLADAAAAGQGGFLATVFDGTEEESLYEVNALVAGQVPEGVPPTVASPLIEPLASWRVVLAYFETAEQSGVAQHEATLRLFENGVVDDQLFDFGEFALRARLVELTERPRAAC
jgi:hypothetical protein